MQDQPSARELLSAVRAFLEQVAQPQLRGRAAFHARVAANAVAIVERELELGAGHANAESARLGALLGQDGDLEALNRELGRRLRAGELTWDDPDLVVHLRQTSLDKLAVDQPTYSAYRRALARGEGPDPEPSA